jgi:hypothetical protein
MSDEHDGFMNATYYAAPTRRDPAFAGVFIYAVTTTGVYCRPGEAGTGPAWLAERKRRLLDLERDAS